MVTSEVQSIPVTLTIFPKTVKVGDTVRIIAVTSKKSDHFTDAWSGATKVKTMKLGSLYYSYANVKVDTAGDFNISYEIWQNSGEGTTQYKGGADQTVKVVDPNLKQIKIEMLPIISNPSLQEGGQAVLIFKIPRKYADQGYGMEYSENITILTGPVTSDHAYSYVVGLFKAKETGVHQVSLKAYHIDTHVTGPLSNWIGVVNTHIFVEE